MSIGLLTGAAVSIWSADRLGRRLGIVIPSSCAGLLCGAFALTNGTALAIVAFLLAGALGAASSIASNIYLPELFDTPVRLRGVGFCGAAGRLATASVQFVLVGAFAFGGLPAVVAMLAGIVFTQAGVVFALGPETGSKSLESAAGLPIGKEERSAAPGRVPGGAAL
ncbi:MFS transporter [Bradyrhizobium sp. BR 10289]|nr:MFS transporter [Bradyrhizobium sp. BR 10289]